MRPYYWAVLAVLGVGAVVGVLAAAPESTDYSTPPTPQALDPRFDLVAAEGDDITLHYLGATRNCHRFVSLTAEETETVVRLTLTEERHSVDQFCEAEGILLTATAALDNPLGTRRVIDTTTNLALEVLSPGHPRLELGS